MVFGISLFFNGYIFKNWDFLENLLFFKDGAFFLKRMIFSFFLDLFGFFIVDFFY